MEDASSSPSLETLQAIPERTQEDISAENNTCNSLASSSTYDLSHIHNLFEEDDDPAGKEDSGFSFGELLAYHAKASELAAILKEDSPSLSLNFTFKPPSVVRKHPWSLQNPSYQLNGGSFLPATNDCFAEFSQKKLIPMNSSGPTRSLAVPPSFLTNRFMSHKFLDAALYRNLSASSPLPTPVEEEEKEEAAEEEEGDSKSFEGSDPVHVKVDRRREKDHRVYALKPRKESNGNGKTKDSRVYVDLNDLLLRCADVIGFNNRKAAMEMLVKVKQLASPYGNGAQRMAYYFAEALDARLAGTGWQIYLGCMRQHRPSSKEIHKAICKYMSSCPFAKASRFFVNQKILEVAKGASTLHIMEFQMTGFQYPSLFKALAARPGGPPLVRLIGGNVPHHLRVSSKKEVVLALLEQTGRQLTACAASYGVPFHFTAWAGRTGTFEMQDYVSPNRSPDEVLVMLSIYPLRYIIDDLLNPPGKRLEIFKTIRAMNPEAYIHGIVTGSYNTPFFSQRFRQALFHFESQFDMLDTFIDRGNADRIVFESEILGKSVLNIVACEQTDVIERVDKHHQWHAAAKKAGLKQIPLNPEIKQEVQKIMKSWHKDYVVGEDLNYLLMGWRGRTLHALSAWEGRHPSEA